MDHEETYTKVGRILGSHGRGADLLQLADCLKTSGAEEASATCDKVLAAAIAAMASADRLINVEALVPLITSVDLRVRICIHLSYCQKVPISLHFCKKCTSMKSLRFYNIPCRKNMGDLNGWNLNRIEKSFFYSSPKQKLRSAPTLLENFQPKQVCWLGT